ncbi:MAG: DUF1275 domain-containing protein [Clostridiales bacterium]|uniref:YoaK family protein n=1 Tax=Clostridium sp. N3C TaxID=1776758 RepID=UPI00092DFF1A|nr:YoaK family protein [Clostridium sp. N3C]NLZ49897.1 DUF1275 domain-containing protein [Clostridiales bacterium]SCN25427.1 putative membrane protein [Clostridium sp. N3C]
MNDTTQGVHRKSLGLTLKNNRDLILHSLMCSLGGFLGGYAVLCRGNLASAQTLNMIDIVLDMVGRNKYELFLRILALFLYIMGIELVEILSKKTQINLQRYSICVDMAGLLVLIMIPKEANVLVGVLPIFFILSTQWSVFHGVRGYNSATIFSTNNLRQTVLAINEYAFGRDRKELKKALYYINTLFWFNINIAFSYFAVKYFGIYASLFGFIYTVPALVITFMKDEKAKANISIEPYKEKIVC